MDVDMVATNTATISNSNSNKTNRNDERYYDTENNDDDDDKEFDEKFLHSSPRRQQAKPGTPHANIVCTVYIWYQIKFKQNVNPNTLLHFCCISNYVRFKARSNATRIQKL